MPIAAPLFALGGGHAFSPAVPQSTGQYSCEPPLNNGWTVMLLGTSTSLGFAISVAHKIGRCSRNGCCCRRRRPRRTLTKALVDIQFRPCKRSFLKSRKSDAGMAMTRPGMTDLGFTPASCLDPKSPVSPGVLFSPAEFGLPRTPKQVTKNLHCSSAPCLRDALREDPWDGGLQTPTTPRSPGILKLPAMDTDCVARLVACKLVRCMLTQSAEGMAALVWLLADEHGSERMLATDRSKGVASSSHVLAGVSGWGSLPRQQPLKTANNSFLASATPLSRPRRECTVRWACAGLDEAAIGHGLLEQQLGSIFDAADTNGDGVLNRDEIFHALRQTELQCNLGLDLTSDDVNRLLVHLSIEGRLCQVHRDAFIHGIKELVEMTNGLGGLSLRQLQDVLLFAFERFDLDGDGRISITEFTAAVETLGLRLSKAASRRLHKFLDSNGDGFIDSSIDMSACKTVTQLDRWVGAFRVAMEAQYRRRGLDKLVLMAETLNQGMQDVRNPLEGALKLATMLVEYADQVVDIVEIATDVVAVLLCMNGIGKELAGVQAWDDIDLSNLTPLLLFLGFSGMHMTKEFTDMQAPDLSEDEALLYVTVFQHHGFTVDDFRKLLEQGGAQWLDIDGTNGVNALLEDHLFIVVRGTCEVRNPLQLLSEPPLATLGPGSAVGATKLLTGEHLWHPGELVATRGTHVVCWELDRLNDWLLKEAPVSRAMHSVLVECMTANRRTVETVRSLTPESDFHQHCIEERLHEGGAKGKHTVLLSNEERKVLARASALSADLLACSVAGSPAKLGAKQESTGAIGQLTVPELPRELKAGRGPKRVPDATALKQIFDNSDLDRNGLLCIEELHAAVREVCLIAGLVAADGPEAEGRIVSMVLSDAKDHVDCDVFIASMQEITIGLTSLGNLSLRQLQEVLASALDKFDTNGDGQIDYPEFQAAMTLLQVDLPSSAVRVMYRFLDPSNEGYLNLSEEAFVGKAGQSCKMAKFMDAFAVAMKGQIKRKGLEQMSESLQQTLAGGGTVIEKFQKGLGQLPLELLQDTLGILVDAAPFLTAANCMLREMSGNDSLENLDISRVAPFLMFMGLSGAHMLRELTKQAVKDLTEDEALLYAQVFQSHGFSRIEFRQLLRQAGATWEEAPPDSERVLDSKTMAQRLYFVVRGGCKLHSSSLSAVADTPGVHLSFGGTIGEASFANVSPSPLFGEWCLDQQAVLEPGTRLVCWDVERLRRHLALHEGTAHRLHTLLLEAAATKLVATQESADVLNSDDTEPRALVAARRLAAAESQLDSVMQLQQQGKLDDARNELDSVLEEVIGLVPRGSTDLRAWRERLREAAPKSGSSCNAASASGSPLMTTSM